MKSFSIWLELTKASSKSQLLPENQQNDFEVGNL